MKANKDRGTVLVIFFLFMLLHQSDKLLIGSLTIPIQTEFGLTDTQMGAVSTGALFIGAILYPLWGYLYDRYTRPKLLALASLIWGATTWLSAIAPTYNTFLVTRASTGIDDSSYPGLYSMTSDYFSPRVRGRVYGLLQLTMPLGYLMGMIMALTLSGTLGWRAVFYITGTLGVVLAAAIFFFVKDVPRGSSEPEMENLENAGFYKFSWASAKELFKKKTLILLFTQGFFGVFPWNVISFWFIKYLAEERKYGETQVILTMVPVILILAAGYPLGGAIGDFLFKRDRRGRVYVAAIGVIVGAVLLYFTLNIPLEQTTLFAILLGLTALFIPLAAPNVVSTVYDVTLPEVRSSALAVQYFIESFGAAAAPLLAGIISDGSSLKNAIMIICISTWIICAVVFALVSIFVRKDIDTLRQQMSQRADQERQRAAPAPGA